MLKIVLYQKLFLDFFWYDMWGITEIFRLLDMSLLYIYFIWSMLISYSSNSLFFMFLISNIGSTTSGWGCWCRDRSPCGWRRIFRSYSCWGRIFSVNWKLYGEWLVLIFIIPLHLLFKLCYAAWICYPLWSIFAHLCLSFDIEALFLRNTY